MRSEALTFFRFLAAIHVVIYHYCRGSALALAIPGFVESGPLMVTFFFVLSGFVMVLAYYDKNEFSAKEYWASRVARIIPVYFVASAISAYFNVKQGNFQVLPLVLNLGFIQSWIPTYSLSFNFPSWSLCAEAFFYATFPLIIMYLRNNKPSPKKMIIISLSLWVITQVVLTYLLNSSFYQGDGTASHEIIYYFPLSHFCSFILGIAGAYFVLGSNCTYLVRKLSSLNVIILLTMVLCYLEYRGTINDFVGIPSTGTSFYAPLFLVVIICLSLSNSSLVKLLSTKPFVTLGAASYSLYILQSPVFKIFAFYIAPYINPSPNVGYCLLIFLNVVVAIVSYYVIEMPGKRLVRYTLICVGKIRSCLPKEISLVPKVSEND